MTHFVGLVVADNEKDLEQLLAPYDEQKPSKPYFEYISEGKDWNELESMQKQYKTKSLEKLLEHMEDWNGNVGEIRDGRLGSYHTYNQDSKWDWYVVGGRWEGIVPSNQCLAEEVISYFDKNDEAAEPYIPAVIVDRKGWHSEKDWGWFGSSTPIEGQEDVVKQKLEDHKGKNVFIVDFHI